MKDSKVIGDVLIENDQVIVFKDNKKERRLRRQKAQDSQYGK